MMAKVLIGLNSYNDLSLLKKTLPVLEQLRVKLEAEVVVLDTAWNDEVRDFVATKFAQFRYVRHSDGNIGYGRSYNEMWRQFGGVGEARAELFLVVTSDVLLDVPTVETFVKRMQEDPSLTMVAGKLHWWDVEHGRTTTQIDSLGIMAEQRHHFYDRGCGEKDRGQYDAALEHFFGISGAVFLIRTAAIARLGGGRGERGSLGAKGALFDERMWMYKEDIDLAYRLRWMGERVAIFPEVWGWHGRTVANREGQSLAALTSADRGKRDYARFHSYKNHLLLLKNNLTWAYGPAVLARVFAYELAKAVYVFFRSPKTFFAGLHILLFVPGKRSPRHVDARSMLTYFD